MKLLYLIVGAYVFLLINMNIGPQGPDLLLILLFFVAYNETLNFSIIFGFLLGLIIDLLYPRYLGICALVYTILPVLIQFLKIRLYQNIVSVSLTFILVIILKVVIVGLTTNSLKIFLGWSLLNTIIFFLPIFLISNRLIFKSWMRRV